MVPGLVGPAAYCEAARGTPAIHSVRPGPPAARAAEQPVDQGQPLGWADVRPGQDSLRLRALDRADFERFIQSVQAETTGLDLARCCPRPLQLDALFTDGCDPAGVDLSAGIDQITALMQLKPRCRVRCRRVPTGANRDQGADQIERCPDQADLDSRAVTGSCVNRLRLIRFSPPSSIRGKARGNVSRHVVRVLCFGVIESAAGGGRGFAAGSA